MSRKTLAFQNLYTESGCTTTTSCFSPLPLSPLLSPFSPLSSSYPPFSISISLLFSLSSLARLARISAMSSTNSTSLFSFAFARLTNARWVRLLWLRVLRPRVESVREGRRHVSGTWEMRRCVRCEDSCDRAGSATGEEEEGETGGAR